MLKRILIFGASGLTGTKITMQALKHYDVYGTYNFKKPVIQGSNLFKFDICNSDLEKTLAKIEPDIVINTTALHNVDYCESHPNESFNINTKFVELLSRHAKKLNFKFIHTSTDYVFDGKQQNPYSETDPAYPINIYGHSKHEGEKISLNFGHTVVRTSVVYGWSQLENSGHTSSSGKTMNFVVWLLNELKKKSTLKIVTDQFTSATLADSLASSILKIAASKKNGLYHITGLGCDSRYEFSVKVAKEFGYDSDLILKTNSFQFKQKAKRPNYSCLDSTKFMTEFNFPMLQTKDGLKIMKGQISTDLLGPNS